MLRSLVWGSVGFAAAHVLESAWHRFIAHGKTADPTRSGHLEHHRKAAEEVDVWGEIREHAGRVAKTLAISTAVLTPVVGLRRAVPLTAGLAAGFVAVNLYHARMHRRAPRGPYERWMWRFH